MPEFSSGLSIMNVITIDGPAGAGKSTVAKKLAAALTERMDRMFEYLDTGAMYRAITLQGMHAGVDWDKPDELEKIAADYAVTACACIGDIRSPEVTAKTRYAADNPVIRQFMVELQRKTAQRYTNENKGLVTEGRDQGTLVFPDADYKFYLTAAPEERAKRRVYEMQQINIGTAEYLVDFNEILQQINDRDKRDSERPVAPLKEPPDAHRIVSDKMSVDEVVEAMMKIVTAHTKICGIELSILKPL